MQKSIEEENDPYETLSEKFLQGWICLMNSFQDKIKSVDIKL